MTLMLNLYALWVLQFLYKLKLRTCIVFIDYITLHLFFYLKSKLLFPSPPYTIIKLLILICVLTHNQSFLVVSQFRCFYFNFFCPVVLFCPEMCTYMIFFYLNLLLQLSTHGQLVIYFIYYFLCFGFRRVFNVLRMSAESI